MRKLAALFLVMFAGCDSATVTTTPAPPTDPSAGATASAPNVSSAASAPTLDCSSAEAYLASRQRIINSLPKVEATTFANKLSYLTKIARENGLTGPEQELVKDLHGMTGPQISAKADADFEKIRQRIKEDGDRAFEEFEKKRKEDSEKESPPGE